MGVYCHRCGTQLPVSARFCSACGAGIPTSEAVQGRPLVRPIFGRKIAGVCIAMSQAYGWDIALVRIFTVVGIVAVAYIAGWIGIPEESIAAPGVYPPGI